MVRSCGCRMMWWMITRGRFVVSWLHVRRWRWVGPGISVFTVTLGGAEMVTGTNVFIENGPVGTVERILFAVGMAHVIELLTERKGGKRQCK